MVDEIAAKALLTQFDIGQVYHDNVPEHGSYPMVCYEDLTISPALHTDNALYGYTHNVRVTVVTYGNAGINELKEKVYNCMTAAGFVWQSTNKVRDGKEYYTALDFVMLVKN